MVAEPLVDQVMGKVAHKAGFPHLLLSGIAPAGSRKTGALLEAHMETGARFRRLTGEEARR
jgi:hypothetical protein